MWISAAMRFNRARARAGVKSEDGCYFRFMSFRKWMLSIVAIAAAGIFITFGLWQLRRLDSRQQQNSLLASRRFAPEVEPASLPADTASARFRRVRLRGRYDFDNEIIHTLRGRSGSPGV